MERRRKPADPPTASPSWGISGRIGAASARETPRNDPTRPVAKPLLRGPFPPVSPGSETGVSGLIILRLVVRVHPAPPRFRWSPRLFSLARLDDRSAIVPSQWLILSAR